MAKVKMKSAKKASAIFHAVMGAMVSVNPKPSVKKKTEKQGPSN